MYGFVLAMIGIWIVVRLLHKKPLTAMLTARPRFDYNRALFAMLVGLVVFGTPTLLLAALGSEVIVFQSPDVWEYTTFFMFAVVLIAFQAGFEEVFFRGYLMQGFALLTRNKVTLALATAIVFALPHLPNPEPWEYGVRTIRRPNHVVRRTVCSADVARRWNRTGCGNPRDTTILSIPF